MQGGRSDGAHLLASSEESGDAGHGRFGGHGAHREGMMWNVIVSLSTGFSCSLPSLPAPWTLVSGFR